MERKVSISGVGCWSVGGGIQAAEGKSERLRNESAQVASCANFCVVGGGELAIVMTGLQGVNSTVFS